MNYDCERPTSRVSKPPGGGSSNIFGGSDANAPTMANKSNNPSYRSSVFSTDPQPENHEVKSKNECTEDGQCKECRQLGETLCSNLSLVDKKEASCLKENGAEGEGKDEAKGVIVGSPKKTNTYSSSVFETPEIPEARHPVLRKYTSSLVYGEENRCREQIKDSNNCSSIRGTNQRRLSNIPMFDTDKRPTSAPALSTRGCGKISRSSVFMHSNYPEDPSTQPGLVTRPNTAYKPANANTKSSLFCNDHSIPIKEVKESYRKPLSKKSTVFEPAPKQVVSNREVSNTFKSSLNEIVSPAKFLQQKRSSKSYNESTLIGSSCDAEVNGSEPVILSSDYYVAQLKPSDVKQNSSVVRENKDFVPNSSSEDVITTSGASIVHLKRQPKSTVSDNFKSEGFEVSSGVREAPVCHPSFGLWSSDPNHTLQKRGITRSSRNNESQIFSTDHGTASAPLWSSDFCRSPMQTDRKHTTVNKSLASTIFSQQAAPAARINNANNSFKSTVFMP